MILGLLAHVDRVEGPARGERNQCDRRSQGTSPESHSGYRLRGTGQLAHRRMQQRSREHVPFGTEHGLLAVEEPVAGLPRGQGYFLPSETSLSQ